jgi:hypothetical protein
LTALAVVVLSAGIIGMDLGRNDSQASATGHHSKGGPMPSTSTGPSTASSPTIPGSTAPPAQKVTVSGSTVLPIGATGRSNPNPDPNSSTSLTTGIVTANGTTTLTHATTPPTRSTTPAPPPTTSAAPTPPPPQGNPPQSIQGAQKQVQPSCTCLPQLYDARISWFLQSDATAYDVHYTYPGDTSGDPSLDKTTRVTDNSLTIPGFHARPDNLCYAVRAVNEYGTSQWTSLDCYT